jgi:hypothetical protein
MHAEIRSLIAKCIQLEEELGLLTPVMLFLNPSWNVQEIGETTVAAKTRLRFRQKWNLLGGWDKIKREYDLQERELERKLSDLAEFLEEEGFEIESFKSGLTEDQFSWLFSQKGKIKKHLRGIDLGNNGGL